MIAAGGPGGSAGCEIVDWLICFWSGGGLCWVEVVDWLIASERACVKKKAMSHNPLKLTFMKGEAWRSSYFLVIRF